MALPIMAGSALKNAAENPAKAFRAVFQIIVGSFGLGFVTFGVRGWFISMKGGPAGCDGSNSGGYPPCYDTGQIDVMSMFMGGAGDVASAVGNALGVDGGSATAPSTPSASTGGTSSPTAASQPSDSAPAYAPPADSAPVVAPSSTSPVDWTYAGGIDSWVTAGLALAGLPDDATNHAWARTLAGTESSFDPNQILDCSLAFNIANDPNCTNGMGPTYGLMQILPTTWTTTTIGKSYPFQDYWYNPVVSIAVRAQNQLNTGGILHQNDPYYGGQ